MNKAEHFKYNIQILGKRFNIKIKKNGTIRMSHSRVY